MEFISIPSFNSNCLFDFLKLFSFVILSDAFDLYCHKHKGLKSMYKFSLSIMKTTYKLFHVYMANSSIVDTYKVPQLSYRRQFFCSLHKNTNEKDLASCIDDLGCTS